MSNCKNPKCRKQLVGNEKWICKSCKDKGWDGAKKVGLGVLGVATLVVSAVFAKSKIDGDS